MRRRSDILACLLRAASIHLRMVQAQRRLALWDRIVSSHGCLAFTGAGWGGRREIFFLSGVCPSGVLGRRCTSKAQKCWLLAGLVFFREFSAGARIHCDMIV